jgi:hypothetical protein
MRHAKIALFRSVLAVIGCVVFALPAHAQPMPKPQFAVGDTWAYRSFDLFTKNESFQFTNTVKEVNAVEFWIYGDVTRGATPRFWWQGETATNRFATRYEFDANSPRQVGKKLHDGLMGSLHWPLVIGDSWKAVQPWVNSEGHSGRNEVTISVEAEEPVSTPVGIFKTFKVTAKGYWYNESRGGSGRRESIVWFSPIAKREVRSETRVWTGGGQYFETSGYELLSYTVKGALAE